MAENPTKVYHSDIAIDEIRENPAGRDVRHLDEEYVRFENRGTDPLDLSGWTVENETGERFRFPDGTTVGPDERVTLRSGPGEHTTTEFYWGADRPVWHNAGDTVAVRDADGRLRLRESYNE